MADLDAKQQAALKAVWESAALLHGLREVENMAQDRFMATVQEARKAGVSIGDIAETVGLTPGRLTQMLASPWRGRRAGTPRRAGEIGPEDPTVDFSGPMPLPPAASRPAEPDLPTAGSRRIA